MANRLPGRALIVAISFLPHSMGLAFLALVWALKFFLPLGVVTAAIVIPMLLFYDWVWLHFPGYPWTEWLRDNLWFFVPAVVFGSIVGAWWLWHSVTQTVEKIIREGQAVRRSSLRLPRVLVTVLTISGEIQIRRQVAQAMALTFFLFGALGFLSGHVLWGGGGVQQGHLAIGPGGQLYLTDPKGDSVVVSRPDGSEEPIPVPLSFHTPRGVVSEPSGNRLFVVDTYHQRVVVMDPENPGTSCAVLGEKGTAPGQFHQPSGIALGQEKGDGAHNLYVYDGTRGMVIHFTLKGDEVKFVQEWPWNAPTRASRSSSSSSSLKKCTD